MCSDRKQTRRKTAARLLLFCLGICCAGIFLLQGAGALRSRATASVRFPHEERPVFRSLPETDGKLDINQASAEEIQKANGIGPALSQRIIELREARGGFRFIEELMDVSGIGEKRFEALCALFYCPAPDP